ncbi:MAG: glutathione peroxidase [Chitinophagia bacterium]|jgi:glutathione peroxidase
MIKKMGVLLIIFAAALYIIKRKDMTWRQSILRVGYPLLTLKEKWFPSQQNRLENKLSKQPAVSFFSLKANRNDGTELVFTELQGKMVLIVNTASNCGFTAQYEELEKLHQLHKDLTILAFPANDFKQQEKGSDTDIANFCRVNYGVSFPLMAKTSVVKGSAQHPVFQWLSDATKNGWCNKAPVWNFSKYVINKEGVLTHFFSPQVSPLSDEVVRAIQE